MLSPEYTAWKNFFITREIEKIKALLASFRLITAQKHHRHKKTIWKLKREKEWDNIISLIRPERKHHQHWEQSQHLHNHRASINNVQRVHDGFMERWALYVCIRQIYNNQDKTDKHQILKYIISLSPNQPVAGVKILTMKVYNTHRVLQTSTGSIIWCFSEAQVNT